MNLTCSCVYMSWHHDSNEKIICSQNLWFSRALKVTFWDVCKFKIVCDEFMNLPQI